LGTARSAANKKTININGLLTFKNFLSTLAEQQHVAWQLHSLLYI
jgi:hypothetical protein